jgi:hypothetical protein
MFDWIKKSLFGKQPKIDSYDQCLIEFVEECRRQDWVPESYDQQARSVRYAGGMQVQLNNLFATWLPLDQPRRAVWISKFVRSLAEAGRNSTISPERLADELMPGIRPRVLISNTLLQNWIAGAPVDASAETAWLPFVGELAACVIRDQSNTMSQMTQANLRFANLSIDRAISKAMANFRARMPSPTFEPGDGVFGCYNLEDHQSALLLLEPGKDYSLPPIEGAPVALVPERNVFYVTGSANMPGVTRLLDISQSAKQMPNFCSSRLLQWTGGHWSELDFEQGTANAARQRLIFLHQLTVDYRFQRQLLDQHYQKQNLDIFVSAVLVLHKKNDEASAVSATTLASGTTGTLLPQVERLVFVKQVIDSVTGRAEKTPQDTADVAWSEAMNIVGHLFEPVAYLYPPRFRALGFPDADAWAKLKALNHPHP